MCCGWCEKEHDAKDMIKSGRYCKKCWREYMRFRRYGISPEDFGRLLEKQDFKCAICGGKNTVLKKNGNHVHSLVVDHDHTPSKKIRGLLCGKCNRGLGYFKENPTLLSKAARYLVGWK